MATITGTIDYPTGRPAAGWSLRIRLLSDRPLVQGNVLVVPADVNLTLDNTGSFSVELTPSQDFDTPAPYEFRFTDPATRNVYRAVRDVPRTDTDFNELRTLDSPLPDGYVTPAMVKIVGPRVDGKLLALDGDTFVQVDAGAGGSAGVERLTDLVDTPGSYNGQQGKLLGVNELENGTDFYDKPDTFLQLEDVIADTYRGKARQLVMVDAAGQLLDLDHLIEPDIPAEIARTSALPAAPSDWAEDGNTEQIPADKLANAPQGSGATLTISTDDPQDVGLAPSPGSTGEVSDAGHAHEAKAILPSEVPVSIARLSQIGRWAQRNNPTDVPDSKIPNTIARDNEIEGFAKVAFPATTIPNQKIADDSLTPAKLNADTVAEKQAFRRKIDAAAEGTVSVPFHDVITFTVGTALDGEHRGFESEAGSSYGSTPDPLTFDANNITYQVRQCDQDSTQVEVTITPDPPADAKWAFSINGHSLKMQDAVRINSLEYGTDGDLFQWNNQSRDVIPANGQTFEFIVGNAIDDELARVEAGIVANRPEVMDDRHVEGLAVGNVNNSQKDALHALTPVYTLGTSPDSIFLCEIQAGITSGTNLSFEDYGQRSAVIFSKSISAASAYATLSNEGVLLGEWKILQGVGAGTEIGTLSAYIAKNDDDQIGWYMDWNAGSGGDGTAAGFQVTASVARLQTR